MTTICICKSRIFTYALGADVSKAAADTGFRGGGGGARMVGVVGGGVGRGGVGFWPDTKSGGGGGGVLSVYGPIRRAGGGGGGALGFWPKTKSGGGGGGMIAYRGGPGYSTVVEFMRADINRQRNRAAIL